MNKGTPYQKTRLYDINMNVRKSHDMKYQDIL